MIHRIFTVYDEKAEAYLPPFYFQAVGQAIRAFSDSANDPNHQFNKHPSDYTIFELGHFDDQDAKFHPFETPHSHGLAITFIQTEELTND